MARNTMEAWIPVEFASNVITKIRQNSAVLAYGQPVTMATESRSTPRSGGVHMVGTAKGGAYTEDSSANDSVYLYAQKYTGAVRIAEEDINDALADVVNTKNADAATSFAKLFDNSCLAVTAAKATTNWAFDSLYYILTQTDAVTGYQANANLNKTTAGSGVQYKDLSKALGVLETSDYWSEPDTLVIAHPSLKRSLREILGTDNRPIFNESSNGTAGGGQGSGGTLFGHQIHWSLGAKTSAAPTDSPTGNPVIVFASTPYLMVGNRTPLETFFINPDTGMAAMTDEAILKYRSLRAFAPGHQNAFSLLEIVP
jgi:HK97 family phage major capsid protein